MKKYLIKTVTPEENELAEKRAALEQLCRALAERELNLEEIKLSIARFQHRYFAEIGKKYVQLDELRAEIAELRAKHSPRDTTLKRKAEVAREEARRTAGEYEGTICESAQELLQVEASDETKKLYRKIASIIHPDKSTDEKSHLRTRLMAELNEAYARKDIARMNAILAEWEQSPDAVPGEGTAAELVRTIRAIAQVRRRIAEIEKEISDIVASEIHQLMTRVHEADLGGQNILAEMATALDLKIEMAEQEWASLRR